MRGIVAAGGAGTRLDPATRVLSKQLLPVFDKPMIYHPLSTLMMAGIRDILIVSTARDLPHFRALLGDGAQWGVSFRFAEQARPEGVAQALVVARDFAAGGPVALTLGDGVLYGDGLGALLRAAAAQRSGATIFGYHVPDPERYGVAELDVAGRVVSLEEKPARPRSHHAVIGLYFYDRDAVDIAATLRPSPRGEYEITDVHRAYLARGDLRLQLLGRGYAWFDAGTPDSLHEASGFIRTMERRQGLKIACLEEIAWRAGFIDDAQLERVGAALGASAYGTYVRALLTGPR